MLRQIRETYRAEGVDVWSVDFQAAIRRHLVHPDGTTRQLPDIEGIRADPAVRALVAEAGGDPDLGRAPAGGASGGHPDGQSYVSEIDDPGDIDVEWDYDDIDPDRDPFEDGDIEAEWSDAADGDMWDE